MNRHRGEAETERSDRMGFHRSRRVLCFVLGICLTFLATSSSVFADGTKKGGAGPFFASCCIGPRVGLELNEGKSIKERSG